MFSSSSILAQLLAIISAILLFFTGGGPGTSTPGTTPSSSSPATSATDAPEPGESPESSATSEPSGPSEPSTTPDPSEPSESTDPTEPSEEPTEEPTEEPSEEPSEDPSAEPTPDAEETAEPTPDPKPVTPINYVGLGDSYAAMGTRGSEVADTRNCYQTTDNYAHVILQDERIDGTDFSCSGAWSVHIENPQQKANWGQEAGRKLPPQVSHVNEDTDLISLSLGANDIGYNDVFECYAEATQSQAPKASDCKGKHGEDIDAALDNLAGELDDVYAALKSQAPNAEIVAAGYMPLMVATDTCNELFALSLSDQFWIIDLTNRLNETVAGAATRNDARFAMPADTNQHTGCRIPESERWVDFTGAKAGSYQMHPTAAGHRAMAQAILTEAGLA